MTVNYDWKDGGSDVGRYAYRRQSAGEAAIVGVPQQVAAGARPVEFAVSLKD